MTKQYAELRLYAGITPRDDAKICEGPLRRGERGSYERERYWKAMNVVENYFRPGFSQLVELCGFDRFVETKEEAEEIIDFAKKNIPGASERIKLKDTYHGQIRFWMKLRIDGAEEKDREDIVEKLKQSGYVPKDEEVEDFLSFWGGLMEGTVDEKRQLVRDMKGINPDRPWHEALKFYS